MSLDLAAPQLTIAELYTFWLQNGFVWRMTSHAEEITYAGNRYQAVPCRRSAINYAANLEVDELEIQMAIQGFRVGQRNYSMPEVIKRQWYRTARVRIDLVDYIALDAHQTIFDGYIMSAPAYDEASITLKISSILDRVQDMVPKVLDSEFCQHALWSTGCGLTKANFKVQGAAGTNTTSQTIYASVFLYSAAPYGWWSKGEIVMTSGQNEGVWRTIRAHGNGYVVLIKPYDDPVSLGDTFDVYPGCDKTGATCATKFNNYVHFLGFEYIPKPEVMYG